MKRKGKKIPRKEEMYSSCCTTIPDSALPVLNRDHADVNEQAKRI